MNIRGFRGLMIIWATAGCTATASSGGDDQREELIELSAQAQVSLGAGAVALPLHTGWGAPGVIVSWGLQVGGTAAWSGGAFNLPVTVPVGRAVAAMAFAVTDRAGTPVTASLVSTIVSAPSTTVCTGASSGAGGSTPQMVTFTCDTTHVVTGNEQLVLQLVNASTSSAVLYGVWEATGPRVRRVAAAAAQAGSTPSAFFSAGSWHFNPAAPNSPVYIPMPVETGEVISGWNVWVQKNSASTTSLVVSLIEQESASLTERALGFTASAQAPVVTLGASDLAFTVQAGHSYMLTVSDTTGSPFDGFSDAELFVQ